MEFKKFSGKAGSFNIFDVKKSNSPAPTSLLSPMNSKLFFHNKATLEEAISKPHHKCHSSVEDNLLFLALCHTIVIDKRTGKMNSASPDELALVEGAQKQGYSFENKNGEGVISVLRKRDGKTLRYQLLNSLEFDSTRKRMSVIVRDLQT